MSLRLMMLAGIALVFAGLVATVFYYRGNATLAQAEKVQVEAERDQYRRNAETAEAVNKENLAEMEKMVAEGLRRDLIILGMADENGRIEKELLETSEALNAAKEADPSVGEYLNSAIPEALRKLRSKSSGIGAQSP